MSDLMPEEIREDQSDLPLVSVIVITYNSAAYVLETLESIKNQTYKNIELIVSDDCSRDKTVDVVKEWMGQNSFSFVNMSIIVANNNSGIPANCNQGLGRACGEWVKFIAGDDLLVDNCVESFVKNVNDNKHYAWAMSQQFVMIDKVIKWIERPRGKFFTGKSSSLLKNLIYFGSLPGPVFFYKRKVLMELGGFNEAYRLLEDYPLYIKLAESGFDLLYINKPLVVYRLSQDSVTGNVNSGFSSCMLDYIDRELDSVAARQKMYPYLWHKYLQRKLVKYNAGGWKRVFCSFFVRTTDIVYWVKKFLSLSGRSVYKQTELVSLSRF